VHEIGGALTTTRAVARLHGKTTSFVDGVVVYKGGMGPFDYRLWEVQEWLAERYGARGASLRK
jgi:hypothetical protein